MPRMIKGGNVKAGTNTVQLSLYVKPGLRLAVERAIQRDGIDMSALIRRAVMRDLGVDAEGNPIGGE